MTADWFARFLRQSDQYHARYAFFLGAGCSTSSGIPAAGDLVRHVWLPTLRDLQQLSEASSQGWVRRQFPNYDPNNPAASYGDVMAALLPSPGDRQREIENLCRGKLPSFGYAMLATLMVSQGDRFNVALTTNFDDLIADALYIFTRGRPLVVHHEALAGFIRRAPARPLIAKLHGDNRLAPLNTADETALLSARTKSAVCELLRDCGLVFVGYGGRDEGILEMFESLPLDALPHGTYWVGGAEPTGALRPWLERRNATWVEHRDFDELMLLLMESFGLPHADAWRLEEISRRYDASLSSAAYRVRSLPDDAPGAAALKSAVANAEESPPGWWVVELQVARFKAEQPGLADTIYRRGVDQFPTSAPLLGNYANFLKDVRKDYDRAETFYRRAIDADPHNAVVLGDYAVFRRRARKDNAAAERFYRRSFAADPQYAVNLSNYAVFLRMVPRDLDAAEEFHKRALAANPYDPAVLGAYAPFLSKERKDHDRAEELYVRALEADPTNVHNLLMYASFLEGVRDDPARAGGLYDRAVAIGIEDDALLGNLAVYLWEERKDPDRAEECFRRAIAADPEDAIKANDFGNFAAFLSLERGEYETATRLYREAMTLDPRNVRVLGNYAAHLKRLGAGDEAVERAFRQALSVDPDDPTNLGNYGIFLSQRRSDHRGAEELFRRALELDPGDANTRVNYAGILLARGALDAGLAQLDLVLRRADACEPTARNAEAWFCAYAHGPGERRGQALGSLRRIVDLGGRSPGWDLRPNIDRARQDGHPRAEWLDKLADVITGSGDTSNLNGWDDWTGIHAN